MKTKLLLPAVFAFLIFNFAFTACGQGSLTPPGAPAPTMKTLDQIEPRTPISSLPFDIIRAGSYYLTTNLTGSSGNSGIIVETNNVTIDLNGFCLLGVSGSYNGVFVINAATTNIVVCNGTISGWTDGYGISVLGKNATLEHLTLAANYNGVQLAGIGVVRDCLFIGNTQNGLVLNGSGCLVLHDVFSGNNSANVAGNASIAVQNNGNRIEDNQVTGSGPAGRGISAGAVTNNLIIRNSVFGGGGNNFVVGNGNIVGPLVTNTASGIITNSNPWANFSF